MSVLKNIWHDLIEKKLWPIALALVILIVAVPVVLGKPGETPTPPAPPVADTSEAGPTLALTATGATGFARAPRVNKKALDPFASRGKVSTADMTAAIADAVDAVTAGGSGGSDSTGDTGTTGPSDTTTTDDPKSTTPKKVKKEKDDLLTVMIQTPEGEPTELADIRTLSPLPDADNPFLVYVGKASGGKASFLVSSTAVIQPGSQGVCAPSFADCRTLEMEIGDTAEFLVPTEAIDGTTTTSKVAITYVDMETKSVAVDSDSDTPSGRAADLEQEARIVGARALKSVSKDEAVLQSLARQKIKFRH